MKSSVFYWRELLFWNALACAQINPEVLQGLSSHSLTRVKQWEWLPSCHFCSFSCCVCAFGFKMPLKFELCPGRVIGGSNPCFIIAEIGQNHQGDIEIAKKMIKMAKVWGVFILINIGMVHLLLAMSLQIIIKRFGFVFIFTGTITACSSSCFLTFLRAVTVVQSGQLLNLIRSITYLEIFIQNCFVSDHFLTLWKFAVEYLLMPKPQLHL